MSSRGRPWLRASLPILAITLAAVTVLGTAHILNWWGLNRKSDETVTRSTFFSKRYPVASRFQKELIDLRGSGRLTPENELLIDTSVSASADNLNTPPALLWCLLFQESRLDHLEGIHQSGSATGIGQFSYFSFYEVNHHLDRFTLDNRAFFIRFLGRDVRPIAALPNNLSSSSSYYFIPTGIAASAAYLNNRYHHLTSTLKKHGISYDENLMWLYAAMAYNKGTRSVLAFWNVSRKSGGKEAVHRLVSDPKIFLNQIQKTHITEKALSRIWEPDESSKFALEMRIHVKNLSECAVDHSKLDAKLESQTTLGGT